MDLSTAFTVAQVMVPQPVTVPPEQPVADVVRLMKARRVGAVLIVEHGQLVGIFTERDLLHRALDAPGGWQGQPIGSWMTPRPHNIGSHESWEAALSMMERFHVRHLPVVDAGRLVGILSARDLLGRRAEYLDRMVQIKTQELQKAYQELQAHAAQQQLHLTLAGRLQTSLLPHHVPSCPEITCFAHYQPLDPLGGDYYDFAQPDADHLGLLIADASGHSIPAAMVVILARTAFVRVARETLRPAAVLETINRHLYGLMGEHFVTAFYATFHRRTRVLTYANAGHPLPYRYARQRHACQPLTAKGLPLGVVRDVHYEDHVLSLEAGDRLCLYTDGVVDCRGPQDQTFGIERLQQLLQAHGTAPIHEVVQQLAQQLTAFRAGQPPQDDMTILAAAVGDL